jgi:hypothetical protein
VESRLAALEHQAKDLPVVLAVQAEALVAAAVAAAALVRLALTELAPMAETVAQDRRLQ